MDTKRARLMPERRSLRFIVGPGAVQHQNGANGGVMVQDLHIFVARVGAAVALRWAARGESPRFFYSDDGALVFTALVDGRPHFCAQVAEFDVGGTHFPVAFAAKQ